MDRRGASPLRRAAAVTDSLWGYNLTLTLTMQWPRRAYLSVKSEVLLSEVEGFEPSANRLKVLSDPAHAGSGDVCGGA